MKSFLVCYSCKKGFDYSIEETCCRNCGESIVDPGIKSLVFAVNLCGIETEKSCEGHEGFDEGYYYDHPWIVIHNDNDLEKIRLIVDSYNLMISKLDNGLSRWKAGLNVSSRKYWLFPEDSYKRVQSLQKESEILARFISDFEIKVTSHDEHQGKL